MELSKSEAKTVSKAVQGWVASGELSVAEGNKLLASMRISDFGWRRWGRLSFWIAAIFSVFAIAAFFGDAHIKQLLNKFFSTPALIQSAFFALLSLPFYFMGARRHRQNNEHIFRTEALFAIAAVLTWATLLPWLEPLPKIWAHRLPLIAMLIYAAAAIRFHSILLWICALITPMLWLMEETAQWADSIGYFLGMNVPLRFSLFALGLLLAATALFRLWHARPAFHIPSRITALLLLFVGLLQLSVQGNFTTNVWRTLPQITLLPWALPLTLACAIAIYRGLRYNDSTARAFGMTFLLIDLYSRFYEYAKDALPSYLFYAIAALSLMLLGQHAKKLWQLQLPRRKTLKSTGA